MIATKFNLDNHVTITRIPATLIENS